MTDKDEIKFAIRYLKKGLKSKRTPPLYEELMNELGFVREKELFDTMLKTQEENEKLRKAYNLCDEANIDLKEEIKALRKELNERSWVTLEEQLTKAKDVIKKLYSHVFQGMGFMEINDYNVEKAEAEQFIKESE